MSLLQWFFVLFSIPAIAQVSVETASFRYISADSTFIYSFDIPVVKGISDSKKQQRINEYIHKKMMYSDSAINATLAENMFNDPEQLDSLRATGNFPRSYSRVSGEIELLTDRYLCLRVATGYDYWGAAHGSSQSTFTILDTKTFNEADFRTFFSEKGKRIFHRTIQALLRQESQTDNNEDSDLFSTIVDLGIKGKCGCEEEYCLLFFIEGIASGYGYEEHSICLSDFKGGVNKGSVLYELLKSLR
jgi:hypothetical protein